MQTIKMACFHAIFFKYCRQDGVFCLVTPYLLCYNDPWLSSCKALGGHAAHEVRMAESGLNLSQEGFIFMPLMNEYTKDTIKESILNKLLRYYGCTIEEATPKQIYAAVASTVRDQFMLMWRFD